MSALDFEAIAADVADGHPVDWAGLEQHASAHDQRVLRQLRALAAASAGGHGPSPGSTWAGLEIEEALGTGTFGTVFRAHEPALGRDVALKLWATDDDLGAAHEGRVLAQLRHPNVVTVFGAAAVAGRVGMWMELIDGRTLRAVVDERGTFSAHEAAVIGLDLCRALAAVHAAGFVHGDVKAQNVMREQRGRIVLMDFGAGRRAEAGAPAAVGTPAYLAPEVFTGAAPDPRADLYALGVLLFFLVTATFPVSGDSMETMAAAHGRGERRRLRDLRPDLPDWFVHVVERATAVDPRDRPATAGAMEHELVRALAAPRARAAGAGWEIGTAVAAVLLAIIAGGAYWVTRGAAARPGVVAIGAFDGRADDRGASPFGDQLTTQLAAYADLRVLPIGEARTPVVSGRVVSSADGDRLDVQVVDADRELWRDSFTIGRAGWGGTPRAVAVALEARLSESEWPRIREGAGDDVAASMFIRGRAHLSLRTEAEMNRALSLFLQATSRQPGFALAHAGVAQAYTLLGVYFYMARDASLTHAEEAARKAVTLGPNVPEAHAILGYVQKLQFDLGPAEQALRHAIALKPDYTDAHLWLSAISTQLGRFDDAFSELKSARALEPNSLQVRAQFGATLLLSRRFDEAVSEARAFIADHPDLPGGYQTLGAALTYRGDMGGARDALKAAIDRAGAASADSYLLGSLGIVEARAGRTAEAARILDELKQRVQVGAGGSAADVAALEAALGQTRLALEWLARANDRSEAEIGYLAVNPRWDALRGHPEFQKIAARVRLK